MKLFSKKDTTQNWDNCPNCKKHNRQDSLEREKRRIDNLILEFNSLQGRFCFNCEFYNFIGIQSSFQFGCEDNVVGYCQFAPDFIWKHPKHWCGKFVERPCKPKEI